VRKLRDVSQDFERVPLVDALVRLLREQNFTLRYGPEGKLRTIGLLGEPQALAAAKTTPVDAGNPDKPASARRHRHRGVQPSRETLPDGQVLVTVAGTDTGGATSPRDALRRPVEVLRQDPRRIRDTPEPGHAVHVHDALEAVDAQHHAAVLRKLELLRGHKLTYVDASSLVFLARLRIRQVWGTDRDLSIEGATVVPTGA